MNITALQPSSILQGIKDNRIYLMGIAIVSILINHSFGLIYNPIGLFNIFYLGVDVFLFLSGFGLCISYERNTLNTFYRNRFLRIFPIYVISVSIAYLMLGKQWTFLIFIENVTTLGFYIDGGINRFDWYISALVTLYLLFPLFYFFSKLKYIGLIIITSVVVGVMLIFNGKIEWWYDCFISRLPVFLYGIMFHKCYKSIYSVSVIGCLLFIPCFLFVSKFMATAFIAVPIIILSLMALKICPETVKRILKFCGKYSLEIYLANVLVGFIILHLYSGYPVLYKMIIFVFVQIVLTIFFIAITNILRFFTTSSPR